MPHYLACTDYGATCGHGNTATPLFLLAVFGVVVIIGAIMQAVRKKP